MSLGNAPRMKLQGKSIPFCGVSGSSGVLHLHSSARSCVCWGGGRHDWVPGRTGTEMPSRFISRSSALGSQERVDWEWLLCQPAKPKLPQRTGASFVAEEGPHFSHSPPPVHTGPVEV